MTNFKVETWLCCGSKCFNIFRGRLDEKSRFSKKEKGRGSLFFSNNSFSKFQIGLGGSVNAVDCQSRSPNMLFIDIFNYFN